MSLPVDRLLSSHYCWLVSKPCLFVSETTWVRGNNKLQINLRSGRGYLSDIALYSLTCVDQGGN